MGSTLQSAILKSSTNLLLIFLFGKIPFIFIFIFWFIYYKNTGKEQLANINTLKFSRQRVNPPQFDHTNSWMLTVYILHQKTELLSNPYRQCTGTGKKQSFKFNTLMPLYITPVLQGAKFHPWLIVYLWQPKNLPPSPSPPFPQKNI